MREVLEKPAGGGVNLRREVHGKYTRIGKWSQRVAEPALSTK